MEKTLKTKFVFTYMKAAKLYAEELSYCVRRKVGAIIVKNNNPIAIGYNGMPSGEPNVCELPDGTTNPRVRHAEINALRKLARSSESSVGASLFVTDSPCPNCAIEIFESGITSVFFERDYHDMSGVRYLFKQDIMVYQVDTVERTIKQFSDNGVCRDFFIKYGDSVLI